MNRRSLIRCMLAPLASRAFAQEKATEAPKPPASPKPIDTPLDLEITTPPTAFRGDGKTHLVYELHATNFGRTLCTLTRLEVGPPDRPALASYSGDDLAHMITRPGPPQKEPLKIEGGLRAVVFLWVTVPDGAEVPSQLVNRLSARIGDFPDEFAAVCPPIVVHKDPVVIHPPLRGGEWLAANGPANASGHRRALIPVGGGAHIAQRFAIDWIQLREDGKTFTGDQMDNKNYRCYGNDAMAVADGVVVAVKDGIPQNVPGATSRAVPITLETVGGNHVILDLGKGRFAFYAHLQPGSLRVKAGDRVKPGQVVGLVGNSGNSTEPHLHFHISDRNSPLASEGLPYATSFEVQGAGFGWKPSSSNAPPVRHAQEMPLQNQVVRFST